MGDPADSRRTGLVLAALGAGLATVIGGCAVLWLAVHVLTGVPEDGRPLADGLELLKAALAIGVSEWAAAAQGP